jgi:predicted permease
MISKSGKIVWGDILSVLKTIVIMYGLPALVFFLEEFTKLDFGQWSIVVALGVGVIVKLIQKYIQENNYPQK